jgi:hypothetical protein
LKGVTANLYDPAGRAFRLGVRFNDEAVSKAEHFRPRTQSPGAFLIRKGANSRREGTSAKKRSEIRERQQALTVICTVTYGDLTLANPQESSPDFYRMRAAHMLKQAETAESEALRKAYQAIAEDWASLAEQTEKAAKYPH